MVLRFFFTVGLSAILMFPQASRLLAQRSLDPSRNYFRVLAVTPIIGSGTFEDPKRPLFAPSPAEARQANQDRADALGNSARQTQRERPRPVGIHSYTWVASDDGQSAIVEFVALDREALLPILLSVRTDVKAFEKGRHSKAEMEQEFRKHRKDFDVRQFGGSR